LCVLCAVVDRVDPDLEFIGVRNDGGANVDPRQVVQVEPSSKFVDDDDE
jgi:hypothetical protein